MLSIVIPVYNEAESLETLFGELDDVARQEGYDLEIIAIDDHRRHLANRDDSVVTNRR